MRLTKENIEGIPSGPGVYKISYPKTINRAIGSDRHGILMIGRSSDLNRRIGQFHTSIREDTETAPHSEGYRYHATRMTRYFPAEDLRFAFKLTKTEKEAKRQEAKELEKYQNRHLELPPLNNIGGL